MINVKDLIEKQTLIWFQKIEVARQPYQEEIQEAAMAEIPQQRATRKRALHAVAHIPYFFSASTF